MVPVPEARIASQSPPLPTPSLYIMTYLTSSLVEVPRKSQRCGFLRTCLTTQADYAQNVPFKETSLYVMGVENSAFRREQLARFFLIIVLISLERRKSSKIEFKKDARSTLPQNLRLKH